MFCFLSFLVWGFFFFFPLALSFLVFVLFCSVLFCFVLFCLFLHVFPSILMGNEVGLYTSPWCYLETPLIGASIETHKTLYVDWISNMKEIMPEE